MSVHSAEEVLDDYIELRENTTQYRDAMGAIAGTKAAMHDQHSPSSTGRPVGMRHGGTINMLGSIPMEVWMADTVLRPKLTDAERAKDIFKRYPQFSLKHKEV